MVLHDVNKPDADASTKSVDVASTSHKILRKNNASTSSEKGTRIKYTFQKKVDSAQKAQNGVLKEIFATYEHLLGEKVRPLLWTELVKKSVLLVGMKE